MGDCGGEVEVLVEVLEAPAFLLSPRLKSFRMNLEGVMMSAGGERSWTPV